VDLYENDRWIGGKALARRPGRRGSVVGGGGRFEAYVGRKLICDCGWGGFIAFAVLVDGEFRVGFALCVFEDFGEAGFVVSAIRTGGLKTVLCECWGTWSFSASDKRRRLDETCFLRLRSRPWFGCARRPGTILATLDSADIRLRHDEQAERKRRGIGSKGATLAREKRARKKRGG